MNQFLRLWILLTCLVVAAPGARSAHGQTTYFFKPSSSPAVWNDANNWKTGTNCSNASGAGQIPSASEDAEICSNNVAQITGISAAARTITVRVLGRIDIKPSDSADGVLTLGSGMSPLTSSLTGDAIHLLKADSGSHVAVLTITAVDHTLDDGIIEGQDDAALISVPGGLTLTKQDGQIEGQLQIVGDGAFVNDALVFANANGTLLVGPVTLDDTPGDRWKAQSGSSSVHPILKFGSAITTLSDGELEGDFTLAGLHPAEIENSASSLNPLRTFGRLIMTKGTLDVLQNLTMGSSGFVLDMTGGVIQVAAGKTFTHE